MKRTIAYAPLPSQSKFHGSAARFKGFSGPIGSGKSAALCQEAIKLAYLNVGRMGLIGAPTYPMLKDATLPALLRVLEENRIPIELNKAENTLKLLDTGSRILLRSLDDYERLRGTNLAWFGVDELTYTSEEAWIRLEGRLRDPGASRLCGYAVWTPKGFDWVWRRFIQTPVSGYECVVARPFENRHLLDAVPDFYERLKSSYDEAFYEQEVLGSYLNPKNGLVYRGFDRAHNLSEVEVDPSLPLLWALDFNVDPMSSIVAQVDGTEVRVLDEIVLRRVGTLEACEEFLKRYRQFPAGLRIYADASANRMQTAGSSDREILEDFFARNGVSRVQFKIPRSNPAVRHRVDLMNAKLHKADGTVEMRVHPRCRELVADFEMVSFVADSHDIDKGRDPKRTHLSDALGYLVWQEFGQRLAPIGERPRRLV